MDVGGTTDETVFDSSRMTQIRLFKGPIGSKLPLLTTGHGQHQTSALKNQFGDTNIYPAFSQTAVFPRMKPYSHHRLLQLIMNKFLNIYMHGKLPFVQCQSAEKWLDGSYQHTEMEGLS
uniref:Uncharacterized protein n=1 Tax=Steinernema glaseri TaxID=37863 RepID=A0A1I7ZBN5_9BILA